MAFTERAFFLLFLVTFFLYYLPGLRHFQIAIIIVASLIFYGARQPYLLLLLAASAIINSFCSFIVSRSPKAQARLVATIGVFLNLSILVFFKYSGLLTKTFILTPSPQGPVTILLLNLPLPLGISFFTFHGISLLVDTWRATRSPAPPDVPPISGAIARSTSFSLHLMHTTFYICFFPQLVSGPITKAKAFYPQIGQKALSEIDWIAVLDSLLLGYFLKLVVANNLGGYTFLMNYPFYMGQNSISLIALIFAYSMQIFADFAGYSLIALGLAASFGYTLPTNFRFPYLSRSFSEFWTRWHISLSSWLRDYLYIPLGGSRQGPFRTYANLIIVMVLGGFWHGAGWSYAIWGLAHGIALSLERPFLKTRLFITSHFVPATLRWAFVFVSVSAAWLLFKLPNFADVRGYVSAVASHGGYQMNWLVWSILFFATPVIIYHLIDALRWRTLWLGLRYPTRGLMLFLIVTNSGPDQPFIYFQF